MTKTKEELKDLKQEVESLTKKLKELSQEELQEIAGGVDFSFDVEKNNPNYEMHIYPNADPNKDFIKK